MFHLTPGSRQMRIARPMFRELRRRSGSFARGEQGSGLVEFAVSALVFLTVVFGVMDFSRAIYIDLFLANTAREAARYASVHGASWGSSCSSSTSMSCSATAANVTAYAQSLASAGIKPASLSVSTVWPGTKGNGSDCSAQNVNNSVGCVVAVTTTYPLTFISPLLPHTTYTLTSTSKATIAQ